MEKYGYDSLYVWNLRLPRVQNSQCQRLNFSFLCLETYNVGLLLCARRGVSWILADCLTPNFLGGQGLLQSISVKLNGENSKGFVTRKESFSPEFHERCIMKWCKREIHDLWIKYHFNQEDILSSQLNHCHQLHQGDWNHHYFSNWLARAGCGLCTNAGAAH